MFVRVRVEMAEVWYHMKAFWISNIEKIKERERLNLIQFYTQVSDLAGWKTLVPQSGSDMFVCQAGLKIIDFASVCCLTVCVCV